ncbi:MAG: hypothetical protein QXI01_02990 [Nitrososphaerota archaeon]
MKVSSAVSKTVSILIAVVIVILVIAGIAYYMAAPVTTPTPSPTTITTPTSPVTVTTETMTTPTQTMTTQTQITTTEATQTRTEATTTTTLTSPTMTTVTTTQTQTRTETTTTVTTPSISPIVNLRTGSYAKYLQKAYTEEGVLEAEAYITFRVEGEGTYNNVNCLLLSTTVETQKDNVMMKSIITWWLSKQDLKMVHGKMQIYYNNMLVYESEFSPLEVTEETGKPPEPIDVNYFVGYETITVPAGTFINCIKVEFFKEEYLMKTWAHQNVPIFGIVKSETYKAGKLMMLMELISYGG